MSEKVESYREDAEHSSVKRSNKLPIYIVVAIAMAVAGFLGSVAVSHGDKQDKKLGQKQKAVPAQAAKSSVAMAENIVENYEGGTVVASDASTKKQHPRPDSNPASTTDVDVPALDPGAASSLMNQNGGNGDRGIDGGQSNQMIQQIQQAKMQLFQQAVTGKSSIAYNANFNTQQGDGSSREAMLAKFEAVKKEIAAQKSEDPVAAYKEGMAKIKANLAGGSNAVASNNGDAAQETADSQDKWTLTSKVKEAARYELLAGAVLPAVLISGINSELPGQIMAQVSQSVYDSASGKYLLIPQGTKLIGQYDSQVQYGQSRVLISWNRLEFPNGTALDINSMPGADSAGYAGFNDQVDNHYLRIFGSALLMSSVIAGVSYTQNQNQTAGMSSVPTMGSAMSQSLGQQLGQVTAQMIGKNMNIAPTLKIRPGYRFNVVTTKDMQFVKPYKTKGGEK